MSESKRPTTIVLLRTQFPVNLTKAEQTFEREYLQAVLKLFDHNVTHTAEALGIHRRTLQKRLRKQGVGNPIHEPSDKAL